MVTVKNSFYKDYEDLLIKNDELSKENRKLRYSQKLLESQNKTLRENEQKASEDKIKYENTIKKQEYEIARLKALLNMDGTNHGIPTSMTPIHKKKVIPTTREKSDKSKGVNVNRKMYNFDKTLMYNFD
jgi:predicted nuclease with TOPRIM domain